MLNQPIKPMLLHPLQPSEIKKTFSASLKHDGFRALIHYENGNVRAFTRHGTEITSRFPELADIQLPVQSAILDGECIVFDLERDKEESPPKLWWDDAMTRFNTTKKSAVIKIASKLKAHFPVWDILYVDGTPLLNKGFMERRHILSEVVKSTDALSVTPLYDDGAALFQKAKELGMEGICQYNPNSPYRLDTRSKDWVKVKAYQYAVCEITSIRLHGGFGWGLAIDGKYVGVLEFPPSSEVVRAFYKISEQIVTGENKNWRFVEPVIRCKVKFQCRTKDGKLRSPKFEEFCT